MSLASEDSERADPYLHHNCEIIMPNDCASWGTLRQGGKEMWLASGRFLERAEPYDMESSRRQYEAIYDDLCKCSRDPNWFLARVYTKRSKSKFGAEDECGKPPRVLIHPPIVSPFLQYVERRDEMAARKASGCDFPWTQDPVLQKHKFCNVRRSEDRATKVFLANVYPKVCHDAALVLLNAAAFWLFGVADFWTHWWPSGGYLADFGVSESEALLSAVQTYSGNPFTDAYKCWRHSRGATWQGKMSESVKVCGTLLALWSNVHAVLHKYEQSGRHWRILCHELIAVVPGIDDFYAQEATFRGNMNVVQMFVNSNTKLCVSSFLREHSRS